MDRLNDLDAAASRDFRGRDADARARYLSDVNLGLSIALNNRLDDVIFDLGDLGDPDDAARTGYVGTKTNFCFFTVEGCNDFYVCEPFTKYDYSVELEKNVADLWWTVDDIKQEIVFELHIKTTGWIALGISPGRDDLDFLIFLRLYSTNEYLAGGMAGADIGVGWIDQAGNIHFQDRYAFGFSKPIPDDTTMDWHAMQGRELNGWTAIQFKRLLDTCDSMDVPIKSGTNVLIFAYGLTDLNMARLDDDISYHENRRGSRIIPLQSYSIPPPKSKFAELDTFEWRMNHYLVPPIDTIYYCKVFKAPSHFPMKHHAVAGDEFVTQCVYSTNNKDEITLGGERTKDEMCMHTFMYYPRINNLFLCRTENDLSSWRNFLNNSSEIDDLLKFKYLLTNIKWTPDLAKQWQQFYNNASRRLTLGGGKMFEQRSMGIMPSYEDLATEHCRRI
ncbi:unnamed protein product [Rotaria sp. Silwood1]|nr:unnamed protein product [Rotaria sp. Silwood1]